MSVSVRSADRSPSRNTNWSSPLPPVRRSLPTPPVSTSAPAPPSSVSAPVPPSILSAAVEAGEGVLAARAEHVVVERVAGAELRRAPQRQILEVAAEHEVDRRGHPVEPLAGEFAHGVAGVVEEIDVVARAAAHRVGAGSAVERIVAHAAIEVVGAAAAPQGVVAAPAFDIVVADGAVAPGHGVVARAAVVFEELDVDRRRTVAADATADVEADPEGGAAAIERQPVDPVPPSMVSTPRPALSWSSPSPPERMSLPVSPSRMSLPPMPVSLSFPACP